MIRWRLCRGGYWANIAVLFILLLIFAAVVSAEAFKRNRKMIILALAMVGANVLIVGAFRFIRGGISPWLTRNTYYFYEAWLFFILIMALLVDPKRVAVLPRAVRLFFIAIFIAGVAYCAWRNYDINCQYRVAFASMYDFNRDVLLFIRRHKREKDFSFAFNTSAYGDKEIGYGHYLFHMSYILYNKYLDYGKPKYLVEYRPGAGIVVVAQKR